MKYLLDTTAYSELLSGNQNMATIVKTAEGLYVPNVVIAELQYGFQMGSRQSENDQLLRRFTNNKKVRVLLPDHATTSHFVTIAVFARKKGVQISSHDIWIAALADQWGATLVSFDNNDFSHLNYPSLKLRLES